MPCISFSVPSEIEAKNREGKVGLRHKVVHQFAVQNPIHGPTGSCERFDQHLGHEHQVKERDKRLKVHEMTF